MELQLTNSLLRPWRDGDQPSLALNANNRNVSRNLRDIFPFPYTLDDADSWIEHANNNKQHNNFAIVVDGLAVGGIVLHLQEDVYRHNAEIGYWLGETYWGRGVMTEAVRAVTQHGFQELKLTRIYAHVFDWNPASARVLEKAGYQFEGRDRNAVYKEGKTIDALRYAAIRPRD